MSHHPPFKQVEASRPDFIPSSGWTESKTPDPEWKPASGSSGRQDLPGVKEGLWKGDGGNYLEIDPKTAKSPMMIYKMMISAITPRPIGFISSISSEGVTNLAPFSYFNAACHNPPIIMVAFTHPGGVLRDTCKNIMDTKEFVANIISEPFVDAANYTSIDAPFEVSEWPLSGLTQVPSKTVKPPRVGESAFSMECVLEHHYDLHNDDGNLSGTVVLGRVKLFQVRDDVIDAESLLVDTAKLQPVSRLGGITYGRTQSVFETERPVWEKEKDREEVKKALQK